MNMPNQFTNDETINVQRAFWAAIVFSVAGVSSLGLGIYLAVVYPHWQIFAMLFLATISAIADVLTVVMIRRGRAGTGLWLIYWSSLITITGNSFLFPNVAAYLVPMILFVGFTIIYLLFPRPWRKVTPLGPLAAALIMLLVEYLNPSFRYNLGVLPTASFFGPLMLAVLVIGILYFIIRQAWTGSLRAKLVTAFVGVTIAATGILGIVNYISTSNILQENLGRELVTLTTDHAIRVGDLFNEQINILTALTVNETLQQAVQDSNLAYKGGTAAIQAALNAKDSQWKAADAANNDNDPLVKEHLSSMSSLELKEFQAVYHDNAEIFITDKYGGLVSASNRTSDYNQSDEGWWQAAYNNGRGAVYIGSPAYDESTKQIGVQIALPISSRDTHELIGILRTTYVMSPLLQILGDQYGQTGEIDLVIPGDQNLHLHEGQIEPIDPAAFDALSSLSSASMVEANFGDVNSILVKAPMRTLEGNPVVDQLGWFAVFHQSRDEAFATINTQVRNFLLLLGGILSVAVAAALGLSFVLIRPIEQLTRTAEEISAGNLNSRAVVTTADEVGLLGTAFNRMTSQLQETLKGLESRVAERTHSLELASEVGRSVSQVRALDVMLKDAAELIRAQFDLYYVQVYLTNASQTELILQAGTGSVGVELLSRGHRLPLNTGSINGRAAVERRAAVVADTTASATFRPNPLLPETRSEMAVPLLVGDRVVGVLDLQSKVPNALTTDILSAFTALAGQLAIAIQNANLLAEAERARADVEKQSARLARANWEDYQDAINRPEQTGFVFEHNEVTPLSEDASAVRGNALVAPISLTGEKLGTLSIEMDEQSRTPQVTELINTVARQVAQQLESVRLLDSAERYRLEAEQTARRMTREGWEDYFSTKQSKALSYMYDRKEVKLHQWAAEPNPAGGISLPLKSRDETIGTLAVLDLDPNDRAGVELVNAVAARLSDHIENLRLLEETQRGQIELDKRARQLAAVSQISAVSSRELDIQKMLETVVYMTQRQFGLYHAHVFTYNNLKKNLAIAACGWKEGDEHEGTHGTAIISVDQEQSIVARAARMRQAVVVNDVRSDPGWLPNPLLPDTASELAVPLVIGDQLLGVLDVQADHINAFTEEDVSIQTTLAAQVATALQNARSFAQAQQQAEREAMLNAINQKIQSATTVEAVLQIAARELGHALNAPRTIAQLSMKEKK